DLADHERDLHQTLLASVLRTGLVDLESDVAGEPRRDLYVDVEGPPEGAGPHACEEVAVRDDLSSAVLHAPDDVPFEDAGRAAQLYVTGRGAEGRRGHRLCPVARNSVTHVRSRPADVDH